MQDTDIQGLKARLRGAMSDRQLALIARRFRDANFAEATGGADLNKIMDEGEESVKAARK